MSPPPAPSCHPLSSLQSRHFESESLSQQLSSRSSLTRPLPLLLLLQFSVCLSATTLGKQCRRDQATVMSQSLIISVHGHRFLVSSSPLIHQRSFNFSQNEGQNLSNRAPCSLSQTFSSELIEEACMLLYLPPPVEPAAGNYLMAIHFH